MKKLLKLLLKFYHVIIDLRLILYQSGILKTIKINTKVVSIGNISFGGTGKTPLTIKIANNLKNKNYKVVILSRGYKRKNENSIKIVYDGEKFISNVLESGDEPFLIAKKTNCPIVVSKDRVKGAKFIIEKFSPDFILLDDAFQHLRIFRDKDIVLISQKELSSTFFLFREPLKNLKRANLIIITKVYDSSTLKRDVLKLRNYTKSDIYLCDYKILGFKNILTERIESVETFKHQKIFLFCGIAYPEYLVHQLNQQGIELKKIIKFSDHVKYTSKEYDILKKYKNEVLFTTEKDEVKLDKETVKDLHIFSIISDVKISKLI